MYMYIITLVKEQRKKYFNREVVFENEKSVTVVRLWVMSFFFFFKMDLPFKKARWEESLDIMFSLQNKFSPLQL